jgi:hypothetical protein
MTSPTGVAWTASTIPVDAPKSIDYSDTLAVAAVCGVDGSSGFVFGVTDAMDPAGVAWSVLTTANEADRVRWSGGLGAFAFLRSSSGASFLWNANTAYALFAADSDSDLIGFTDFAWSEMDGRFLAVKTGYVMSSVDGRAWEPLATSEANEWRGVAATSPGFVGVGQTGSNRAFISTGGSDFIRTFTGIVSEVAQIDGVYRLSIRSAISKALTKELFTSSISALNGAIASGDMSLILDDASGLQADDGYIVIDDEILRYDGRSGNTLTIITRGALSTTAASHADNAKTVEGFYLDGDPVTVLTRVIAGSGQKTSLGMTTSDLDLLSLVDTLIAIGSTTSMAVFAIEPANGLAWLEKNIFSVLAAYPIENAQGQIGIKLLDTPSTFSDTLNDADIFARPRWLANQQNQINVVTYRYDLGSIDKEFATTRAERDSTAITAAGKEFTRTIDSAGLRAALSGTATFVDARIDSWLERFSGPCSAIEVEVMLQKELLEQGDDIEATFTVTPDPETGDREIVDAPMEITSIRQDFMANKIRFSLLGYPA